jgi:RNA polymerase sigma factor (sigma-70 family)
MPDPADTRTSLLARIRDPGDKAGWERFVEVYAPLVYGFARRHGLQDADAADLTQEVLWAVACASGRFRYDPARGSFRGWLFTVARNRLRNALAQRRRDAAATGANGLLEAQPAPEESTRWDQEYEQRLFEWAAGRARGDFEEATWQAFWRTAVGGESPREVGEALGLSVGAVYIARSRVLANLREQVRQLDP